jgi:hypothetical protein
MPSRSLHHEWTQVRWVCVERRTDDEALVGDVRADLDRHLAADAMRLGDAPDDELHG